MPPRQRSATNAVQPLDFQSTKKKKQPAIPFELDGEEYIFTPPKMGIMVVPQLEGTMNDTTYIKGLFDWLGAGLPPEQEQRLIDRLKDPEDEFDVSDMTQVVKGLSERMGGGRPTT